MCRRDASSALPLVASCSQRRFLILQLVKTHGSNNICLSPPSKSPCFSCDNPFRPFSERVIVFDSRTLLLKLHLSSQFVPLTTFGPIHHLRAPADPTILPSSPRTQSLFASTKVVCVGVCSNSRLLFSLLSLLLFVKSICELRRLRSGVEGPCSSDQNKSQASAAPHVLLTASSSRL
jgi:hypothetical protein